MNFYVDTVWAYGVTLWEIFTRQDPYPDLTAVEAATRVTQTTDPLRLPVPSSMSKEMEELYLDLFELDTNDRPSFEEICTRLSKMDTLFAVPESDKERDGEYGEIELQVTKPNSGNTQSSTSDPNANT
jgi:serine/threonine protein kinase